MDLDQATGNQQRDLGSWRGGGLHAAAQTGEGGNVICGGREVRKEVLTHFLFLLLGWQISSPDSLEFTSLPPTFILQVQSSAPAAQTFTRFQLPFRYFQAESSVSLNWGFFIFNFLVPSFDPKPFLSNITSPKTQPGSLPVCFTDAFCSCGQGLKQTTQFKYVPTHVNGSV